MDKSKGVRLLCSDKELGQKVLVLLAEHDISATLIEEQADIAYLDARDELQASQFLATVISEIYLENSFLIGQYNYLHALLSDRTKKLQAKPLDISLTTEIKKISNDLEIIEPAMRKVNAVIFTHLEKKHGNGLRFVYNKTL